MGFRSGLRLLLLVVFLAVAPNQNLAMASPNGEQSTLVLGEVAYPDGGPGVGAQFHLYSYNMIGQWVLIAKGVVDEAGRFSAPAPRGSDGWTSIKVLVFYDDPETPGVDFFAYERFGTRNNTLVVRLTLIPAASVELKGRIYLLEFPFPISLENLHLTHKEFNFYYEIHGLYAPTISGGVPYIPPSTILVPAKTRMYLNLWLTPYGEERREYLPLRDPLEGEFSQGGLYSIDLNRGSFLLTHGKMLKYFGVVEERLLRLVLQGLLSFSLESELQRARALMIRGEGMFNQGDVEGWFTHVKMALMVLKRLEGRLDEVGPTVAPFTLSLPTFFFIVALLMAAILFERPRARLLTTVILMALFFAVLSLSIPGAPALLLTALINPLNLFIILTTSLILVLLPKRALEARLGSMSTYITLARRNMRRMRLRTLLLVSTVAVTTFGFTFFLNVFSTPQFVYVTEPFHPSINGILVKKVTNTATPGGYFSEVNRLDNLLIKSLPDRDWVASSALLLVPGTNITIAETRDVTPSYAATIQLLFGFQFDKDPITPLIRGAIIEGELPPNGSEDHIMIVTWFVKEYKMRVSVGGYLTMRGGYFGSSEMKFKVSAFLDRSELEGIRDLDGESLLSIPIPYIPVGPIGTTQPQVIVVTTYEVARKLPTFPWRITLRPKDEAETLKRAEQLAYQLGLDYEVYAAFQGSVGRLVLSEVRVSKGFTEMALITAISMLIIFNATLSSSYERKKHAFILHTLGADPTQISTLFLTEYILIALLGSLTGYVAGVTTFPVLRAMKVPVDVNQKISLAWSLLAIVMSLAMAAVSTFAAVRRGWTYWRPSIRVESRRIWAEGMVKGPTAKHILPLTILEEDTQRFLDFIEGGIKAHEALEGPGKTWGLQRQGNSISYFYLTSSAGRTYNSIGLLKGEKPNQLTVKVSVRGNAARAVEESLAFIRKLASLQWSHVKGLEIKKSC